MPNKALKAPIHPPTKPHTLHPLFITMDTSKAQEEIDRIEREIDAKNSPRGKPPVRENGSGNSRREGSVKNQSLDAVLVGVVLLLGISATFALGERLTATQRNQLSAGAIGSAAGLAIGYGVGRWRNE